MQSEEQLVLFLMTGMSRPEMEPMTSRSGHSTNQATGADDILDNRFIRTY